MIFIYCEVRFTNCYGDKPTQGLTEEVLKDFSLTIDGLKL